MFPKPADTFPESWPLSVLWAATVFLEADGEEFKGKLAVAHVILTRALQRSDKNIKAAILGSDLKAYDDGRPWEVFSCWNDDYRLQARQRLLSVNDANWDEAWKAIAGAYFGILPDPTSGAYFYLNKQVVISTAGQLPIWWSTDCLPDSEITIGRHSFRKKR